MSMMSGGSRTLMRVLNGVDIDPALAVPVGLMVNGPPQSQAEAMDLVAELTNMVGRAVQEDAGIPEEEQATAPVADGAAPDAPADPAGDEAQATARFSLTAGEIDALEARVERQHVEQYQPRLDELNARFDRLNERLDGLQEQYPIQTLFLPTNMMTREIPDLISRNEDAEYRMIEDQGLSLTAEEFEGRFDALEARLDRYEEAVDRAEGSMEGEPGERADTLRDLMGEAARGLEAWDPAGMAGVAGSASGSTSEAAAGLQQFLGGVFGDRATAEGQTRAAQGTTQAAEPGAAAQAAPAAQTAAVEQAAAGAQQEIDAQRQAEEEAAAPEPVEPQDVAPPEAPPAEAPEALPEEEESAPLEDAAPPEAAAPAAEEPPEAADPLPVDGTSDFQIELAGLSAEDQEQVVDAVRDAYDAGAMEDVDAGELLATAEANADNREAAADAQREQEQATEAGDFAAAREQAQNVAGEVAEVQPDAGGWMRLTDEDFESMEADEDAAALDNAEWEQQTANQAALAAADGVEDGDYEMAEAQGDVQADHQALADASAGDTDDEYDDIDTHDTTA